MYDMSADFHWFLENRKDIIKGHTRNDERVVIRNKEILGYYPDDRAAIDAMTKTGLSIGEYSVQRCRTAEDDIEYYYTDRYALA